MAKEKGWYYQWDKFYDNSLFLFEEWIYPTKLEEFKGKKVLDCGCGGGQHLNFIAPYCKSAVGVDLNTSELARRNNINNKNVKLIEADIATMKLKDQYDLIYSIGVLHHTKCPRESFNNIAKFVKKGGKLIVWVYSYEGNFLNRTLLEFLKKIFFLKLDKRTLLSFSHAITFLMYFPIYTFYFLPFKRLPFYYYFQNWRRLDYRRNLLNVFDKLNASRTFFIKRKHVYKWFISNGFRIDNLDHYKKISWRASGTKL